jgi:YidC/Oxa1 family membrane protein insertase
MGWFDGLLYPIMIAVAWIMVQFHTLLSAVGLNPASGAAWGLSIVGLVIVIRIMLIPLFVRQIKASRGMQMLSPEMQAIQKKYKGKSDPGSREAMSRETMALYKKHGTNPFASCLPILAQSPIFFALFRVLYSLPKLSAGTYAKASVGPLTATVANQAEHATIFGAPLSGSFMSQGGSASVKIVTVVLIVSMSLTTFLTQRQLTMKNMPPSALEGPMAQQQKMLLYFMPLIFAFSGVNFPIGVLIYWTTTNLWSMGQQFYTIRRMPAPGSAAEAAFKARQARRTHHSGIELPAEDKPVIEEKLRGQRVQPKRKDRAKIQLADGAAPATGPSGPDGPAANRAGRTGSSSDGALHRPAARAPRKPKQ